MAISDHINNAVFNWAFCFNRDVGKLENGMGTIKSDSIIEECLEKYALKEFMLRKRHNCFQLLKEL